MDFTKLMEQAKDLQDKMLKEQEKMKETTFTAKSGGGVVSVTIDGIGNLKSVMIDEKILNPDDKEMISDLIVAAFNSAKKEQEDAASNNLSAFMPKF